MTLTLSPIIKPQTQRLSLSPRSLSPSSIPSSPSSVHSSSSAIFERDIEPISPPLPPAYLNPHRIPRGKTTESSVPSVLDSAAVILVDSRAGEVDVEVLTPAASPLVSRSPSPRASLLLTTSSLGPPSPTSIARDLSPVPLSQGRDETLVVFVVQRSPCFQSDKHSHAVFFDFGAAHTASHADLDGRWQFERLR